MGEAWNKSLGVMFNGETLGVSDDEGKPIFDDSFLLLVNAAEEGVEYSLPESPSKRAWRQIIDTESIDDPFCEGAVDAKVIVGGRAIRVYSDGTGARARTSFEDALICWMQGLVFCDLLQREAVHVGTGLGCLVPVNEP